MERVPCEPGFDCPIKDKVECFEDIHHEYWPKSKYKTKVEKTFRELDDHKKLMCRGKHNDIHAESPEPEKPNRDEMLEKIKRSLGSKALK